MIDRNIRNTRSKEESNKAHNQAIKTIICLVVFWIALNTIQKIVHGIFSFIPFLGWLLSVAAGIAVTAVVRIFLYNYAKAGKK